MKNDSPIKENSKEYHGSCQCHHLTGTETAVNVEIEFGEALKLSAALQDCSMALIRVDKKQKAGKRMGVILAIFPDTHHITVQHRKLKNIPKTPQ